MLTFVKIADPDRFFLGGRLLTRIWPAKEHCVSAKYAPTRKNEKVDSYRVSG